MNTLLSILLCLVAGFLLIGVLCALRFERAYQRYDVQRREAEYLWKYHFPTDVNPPLDKENQP